MTTIYLIRHAEAEGNLYRRVHGWYDSLVTENGQEQIRALERRFRDIPVDGVWASDLTRARRTARAICGPKGLELHTDPALREVNMGDWEDRTWGEIKREDGARLRLFNASSPQWQAPNGETLAQAGARAEDAIRRIAAQYPGGAVAIVSHGTVLRQALANLLGLGPERWPEQPHGDNTSVTRLTWDGETFTLHEQWDNSHLDPAISTLGRQVWWRKDAPAGARDMNLWFRPMDMERESQTYYQAREESWYTVHGAGHPFDGESFLRAAREHAALTPWGVSCAMWEDELAGLIQLDPRRWEEDNAGYIPFCFIEPQLRSQGLGIQLIGHAVSFYRRLGRDRLRLRCAPENLHAQHFYRKYGFYKIGDADDSTVPLDILEKYIGYDR